MPDQAAFDFSTSSSPRPLVGEGPGVRAPLDVIHGEDMTAEERAIMGVLSAHRGRTSAITGELISEVTGIAYGRVRGIVRHLIDYHAVCVGSCGVGYFIAVEPTEIETVTKSLRHRGISILVRAATLQRVGLDEVYGQGKLELEVSG